MENSSSNMSRSTIQFWLPKTKQGWEKDPLDYYSLDPVEIWQGDAWTFVRRMVGDYLAQKFFYEFMTKTWILIGGTTKLSRCTN